MSGEGECDSVRRWLDGFLASEARDAAALEATAAHVRECASCYDRMTHFFRTIELPPSTYLRETIDELCLAVHQLAIGVIRERTDPEVNTDNMVSVYTRGSAKKAAADGRAMTDDAEDYVGQEKVGDVAFEAVRDLIARAEMSREKKLDLARLLCEQILRFDTRHVGRAANLLGVIHLWQERRDDAERAFLRTLAAPSKSGDDRVFKAFAHCNLGYVSALKGDLKSATLSARRSVAISEEMGEDAFFGLFALVYFQVLQGPAAEAGARDTLAKLLALKDGARRTSDALRLENNREVAATFRASFVGRERPDLVPPPPDVAAAGPPV
jgi:hypothetical protein